MRIPSHEPNMINVLLVPRILKQPFRQKESNGFWMKFTPFSKKPWWAMTSAVYPDMNNRYRFG